jgi:formate dehydrogenase subunit gamma
MNGANFDKVWGVMPASLSPWNTDRARDIIAGLVTQQGATLPILHAVQNEFGYVPDEAIALIADALNLSRAEIHGVVTFYHEFRRTPPGRHVLKLCRAEACQSVGGAALAERLMQRLNLAWGETTSDGSLTIEPVYCLGLCACAPSALLNDEPLGMLDDASLQAALP